MFPWAGSDSGAAQLFDGTRPLLGLTCSHTRTPGAIMRTLSTLALTFAVVLSGVLPALAQDKNAIVAPGAKLEKIWDGGLVLTEGCASAPDGTIYFSDITFTHVAKEKKLPIEAGHIMKYDP